MKNSLFLELNSTLSAIEATDLGCKVLDFKKAVFQIVKLVLRRCKEGNKIILVGNGGSASIASHIATDFIKNLSISALSFNDGSLLTCLSNDLGYENVFSVPIKILANKGDMLFAISSSGKSNNILKAASQAREKGCFVITLSGFSSHNPLRSIGNINFYAPSPSYGVVEIAHLAICHAIVDILYRKQFK